MNYWSKELNDALVKLAQEVPLEVEVNQKRARKEKWRVANPIKDNLRHNPPFTATLGGLHATAVMTSFYGHRHEVCHLFQRLNHTTRAYVIEQKGMPGFVLYHPPSILEWLKDLRTDGMLDKKLQQLKVDDSDAFLNTLSDLDSNEAQEAFLKEKYLILFIQSLQAMHRDDDLMEFCKGLRNDYEHYTYYIEYYLKPWFESLRCQLRLKQGHKQIKDFVGRIVEYEGEILDGEKATGNG